jgi:hypothetical protein
MSSARDRQVGGNHYAQHDIQPWDAMEDWQSAEQFVGFLRDCAIKRLARMYDKDSPLQDAKKAAHELEKMIEVLQLMQDAGEPLTQGPSVVELKRRIADMERAAKYPGPVDEEETVEEGASPLTGVKFMPVGDDSYRAELHPPVVGLRHEIGPEGLNDGD